MESKQLEAQKAADKCYATGITLVAWSIIWMLGFLITQLIPAIMYYKGLDFDLYGLLVSSWWTVMITGGSWFSAFMIRKHSIAVSGEYSCVWRLWGMLFAFWYVFVWLIHPFINISRYQEDVFYRYLGAATAIIPMLAYVIIGATHGRYLLWTGLGITLLTLLGLITTGDWFFLWMAFVVGGTLIVVGLLVLVALLIRRKWKTT